MNRGDGPEFVVQHGYPFLFLGSWFFFLFGGLVLLLALLPVPMPDRATASAIGLGFVGVGVMIRWIGTAWSESFILNDQTITWYRGGEVRLRLSLDEITHVRFGDGVLIIEAARPGGVIQVPVHYAGFDSFFAGLKTLVRSPWVSLVGAAPAQATPALVAPPREVASLPLVHNRWGRVVLLVAVGLGLGAVALAKWLVPSFPDLNEAQSEFLKYAAAAFSVAAFVGIFFIRAEFRIDERGVEDIYPFRSRRYGWGDLASVGVSTQRPYFDGALVVTPKEGALIIVPLGKESYLFCDTALATAARAGCSLAIRGPLIPEERAPVGPSDVARPEGIQPPLRNPPTNQGFQQERPGEEGGPQVP
jgi:hypothetical protein